ncbi:thioredoxin family protein [Teredinibacter sp. KSP-S5-2]|uniref:thioredoxin family protein n=1 Tax=Teredinibacter sp. KSP-S5-2 TaxID=3034506 RepID=UPI00293432E1|nr:thioredoxin family protein [Teredinibacter sp. KSP-S5-2]WNO08825.1 thioredoxin family protein [Teredinibacter sp. KSP-S5-2]
MTELTSHPEEDKKNPWRSLIGFGVLLLLAYFANVKLQSYLGRQAFDATGLAEIPLEQALEKARKENKLVLADMSAIWCPACRKLDKNVLSNNDVQQAINQKYIFTRIEYETEAGKAFSQKYQVSGFPTLLVLDTKGTLVRRLPLTFDTKAFLSNL